jgi:DNA modification methylase
MSLELRIGDVFDRMAEIPDGSIDLIVTSPPFLALRSYLPADHPDKAKEIGSEATPAEFIDTLLALSAEWGRVLAPHGSLCVELGDTYSGSGGGGGDYLPGGLREDQPGFGGSAERQREGNAAHWRQKAQQRDAWPLAKSLTGIPTLYPWSLAYGRNLLTGQPSPAGQWRIRNIIVWARPNPPVGALGDKFRPATSYITVACRGARRYFDLDAVRTTSDYDRPNLAGKGSRTSGNHPAGVRPNASDHTVNPAGAPPLDWDTDHHPEDGDWLWKMATQPYRNSHYATFPMALPKRLIEAMCPLRVCRECGKPSERIVGEAEYVNDDGTKRDELDETWRHGRVGLLGDALGKVGHLTRNAETLGWSDCGHGDNWRTGVVLDSFCGSGTTLEAAQAVGRHAIGIDLDHRNADLAQQRVGLFLEIDGGADAVA